MKNKIFIILTIIWMTLIFYMSHQPATVSSTQSNKIIHTTKKIIKNEEIKNKINSFIFKFLIYWQVKKLLKKNLNH